jgi:hypothetical protein
MRTSATSKTTAKEAGEMWDEGELEAEWREYVERERKKAGPDAPEGYLHLQVLRALNDAGTYAW